MWSILGFSAGNWGVFHIRAVICWKFENLQLGTSIFSLLTPHPPTITKKSPSVRLWMSDYFFRWGFGFWFFTLLRYDSQFFSKIFQQKFFTDSNVFPFIFWLRISSQTPVFPSIFRLKIFHINLPILNFFTNANIFLFIFQPAIFSPIAIFFQPFLYFSTALSSFFLAFCTSAHQLTIACCWPLPLKKKAGLVLVKISN